MDQKLLSKPFAPQLANFQALESHFYIVAELNPSLAFGCKGPLQTYLIDHLHLYHHHHRLHHLSYSNFCLKRAWSICYWQWSLALSHQVTFPLFLPCSKLKTGQLLPEIWILLAFLLLDPRWVSGYLASAKNLSPFSHYLVCLILLHNSANCSQNMQVLKSEQESQIGPGNDSECFNCLILSRN